MADSIDKLKKDMAVNLHGTMSQVFDTECYHGTYKGGPKDGQPFATCEVLADRLLPVIPEPRKIAYVEIFDLATNEWLGLSDSFDGGESFAWGYLHSIDSKVNDGQQILVHHRATGAYSIVISGAILERGDDWERKVLEKELKTALEAAEAVRGALEAHNADREFAEEQTHPKVVLTATDKIAEALAAMEMGQPYIHLLPTVAEQKAEAKGAGSDEETP